ncbi:unnamed protein product [Acanthoscelides obtectus]|uniref:SWI/SNF-related matrix-associated actin-dependent regulator of chromatin subfamily A-like protein 1 n=1 Tax=Acanthoscelides obtectus TaxID=200917 RepID=A0A9P0NZE7_ACAOB|nr:unnamed protein product [Acanthoscelides obtectus]CAK1631433.1 SWI/SNF-related matrix-associated actin-dependent regulator of chromatin subfamily A-like protein 1 [Acanthoscelides obtectus]
MATPLQFYGKTPQTIKAKCVLISSDRFVVELSSFSEHVTSVFRTVPSRIYDPKTRSWNFSISDYNLLMTKLQAVEPKISLEKLPPFVLKIILSPRKEVEIDYERLDPVLSSCLMPFQVEGLRFGIEKGGRCFIGDDMGLGKTFTSLAIASYYKNDWPLLIVTTASMKTTWEETITEYMPTISIMQVQYMVSSKDYIGDTEILIVSHDLMTRCQDKLKERKFGVIIIDESHVLKNFKSKSYHAASQICKQAKRVVLLSGTPALSRPSELFTQLCLIDHKVFTGFTQFAMRYCDGKQTQFGFDASGKSNLQELEVVLSRKFMIRRTKQDVVKSLPKKSQELVRLSDYTTNKTEISGEDREMMKILGEKYASKKGHDKHSILLTFFAETAKIKIPQVCAYVLRILDIKEKFLIFAHHQVMLNAIEDTLKAKNFGYIRIDGSTTSDQRKFFISKFQLNDSVRVAVLSITATNAGITLTAAQTVIFAELHWNPTILSQAEARAHRIGQENEVKVQYLISPGTADDYMWSLLQEKQKTLKEVGLSRDSFDSVTEHKRSDKENFRNAPGTRTIEDFLTEKRKKSRTPEKSSETTVDDLEDAFNDGFDETLSEVCVPEKKIKLDESTAHSKIKDDAEDPFNDGFDDMLMKHTDELLNDDMDEVLCNIDF